jgi:hypothetical protein
MVTSNKRTGRSKFHSQILSASKNKRKRETKLHFSLAVVRNLHYRCSHTTIPSRPWWPAGMLSHYGWHMHHIARASTPLPTTGTSEPRVLDCLGPAHRWCVSVLPVGVAQLSTEEVESAMRYFSELGTSHSVGMAPSPSTVSAD